jgi:hypothetical protein
MLLQIVCWVPLTSMLLQIKKNVNANFIVKLGYNDHGYNEFVVITN